jgi:hypothetical protein
MPPDTLIDRRRLAGLALGLALCASPAIAGARNAIGIADASACTRDPAASTTIPGWITIAGSPSLRCASPVAAGAADRAKIVSGPYGSSTLERRIDLRRFAARIDRGRIRYRLSGRLGATGAAGARAVLTLTFLDGAGRALAPRLRLLGLTAAPATTPRPATTSQPATIPQSATTPRLAARRVAGALPRGTRALRVVLTLVAPDAARGSAVAEDLRLTLGPDVPLAPVAPPRSRVPRFDHVFLIMMENTSYRQVIGDRRDAPFINALARRGVLLANYRAVYHPSDENYLAIASGSAGVRGPMYFPHIHLAVRHLGDVIEAAGLTWKAYEQGMGTPCNTTTKYDKYYEPDDAPFVNYANVIDDPARCRAHLVDTKQLAVDLASTATTPSFAWIAADDYDDGEDAGNGSPHSLVVQDAWLRRTLEPVFASPAWRTQRSLLILTWDESSTTLTNHVATILWGSRGTVRHGAVSRRRYDHYSTARTIEAALGLPSITANDAYARPIDDAFVR